MNPFRERAAEQMFDPTPFPPRTRPYKAMAARVERGDWFRASGDVVCERCGCAYYDHQPVVGFTWLRMTCNGDLVKL